MVGLPVATGSQQGGIFEATRFVGAAFSALGHTWTIQRPLLRPGIGYETALRMANGVLAAVRTPRCTRGNSTQAWLGL